MVDLRSYPIDGGKMQFKIELQNYIEGQLLIVYMFPQGNNKEDIYHCARHSLAEFEINDLLSNIEIGINQCIRAYKHDQLSACAKLNT